ncbi:hypothetical protein ACLB2K_074091 [Fragaria x ananassa]
MNLSLIDREELASSPQDLMSSLLVQTYCDGEELTEDQIAKRLCGVLLAGYDCVINTVFHCHLSIPVVYESVQKEKKEDRKGPNAHRPNNPSPPLSRLDPTVPCFRESPNHRSSPAASQTREPCRRRGRSFKLADAVHPKSMTSAKNRGANLRSGQPSRR